MIEQPLKSRLILWWCADLFILITYIIKKLPLGAILIVTLASLAVTCFFLTPAYERLKARFANNRGGLGTFNGTERKEESKAEEDYRRAIRNNDSFFGKR